MFTLNFNLAFKLIPTFDGHTDGLLKFVEMCETVALTAAAVDNPLFLSIVYSKLEGKAFKFTRKATYADWPVLRSALQKKFEPTKSVAQLQQDLTHVHFNLLIPFGTREKETEPEPESKPESNSNNTDKD
jgi:hypothetical protein